MSPEKTEELNKLYPELGISKLMWGIECDDGWFDLLKDCILTIKHICEKEGVSISVSQIKEKWGTLRFYIFYDPSPDNEVLQEIRNTITKAEKESAITCENCGSKEGALHHPHGRYVTLCPKCYEP